MGATRWRCAWDSFILPTRKGQRQTVLYSKHNFTYGLRIAAAAGTDGPCHCGNLCETYVWKPIKVCHNTDSASQRRCRWTIYYSILYIDFERVCFVQSSVWWVLQMRWSVKRTVFARLITLPDFATVSWHFHQLWRAAESRVLGRCQHLLGAQRRAGVSTVLKVCVWVFFFGWCEVALMK